MPAGDDLMKRTFNASVWKEDGWYVAQCLDVDIASQGGTEAEALQNLSEALKLHFTPPCATAIPEVRPIEVELHAA
jgi:predicted RNase H-like HicB family nuclease